MDGLPQPRRNWSTIAIWLGISMTVLDSTIANIALPTIATELNASASTSIWIVNSYQLAITMLLLPLAALGDRIGYQRVYVPGLVIFVLGSLACALSHTLWQLIAARVLQGIGSAGIMSMNSAMVRGTYPQAVLGRGIGYNALVLSLSAAAGPSVAAAILSVAPWPWLFAINVPMGIAAYLIGARSLPQTQGHGGKPNLPSAALSALAIGGLVFGGEKLGRGELHVAVPLLLVALVAGVLLVLRDRARPAPLLPIDLLRIPIFSLSLCTSIVSFGAQMLAYITLPFLLQSVMGRSVLQSGLLLTAWPLAVGCTAPLAGHLADRYPAGLLGGIGLGAFAIGLAWLSLLGTDPSTLTLVLAMVLCGAGFGFFQSPNNRTIVASTPRERSGGAGGLLATARLLGQTAGAVIVAAGFHSMGVSSGHVLLGGAAVAAAFAAVISLLRLRVPGGTRPAAQTAPTTSPPADI